MKRTSCEAFSKDNNAETHHVLKKPKASPDLISNHGISSNFNDIPDEVMVKILSYLSISDLYYSARLVCKRWHRLAMDYKLWKTITIPDDVPFNDIKVWLQSALNLKHLTIYYRLDIEKILRQVRVCCMELQMLEIINFTVPRQRNISHIVLYNLLMKCQKLKIILFFGSGSTSQFLFRVYVRNKYGGKIKKRVYTEPLNINHLLNLLGTPRDHYCAGHKRIGDRQNFRFRLYQMCRWKANIYPKSYLNALRNLIKYSVL